MKTREQIAQACHEINRALCIALGDTSQLPWEEAPDWQKESALAGVDAIILGFTLRPSDSHIAWFNHKIADGWKYGPVKDPEKKEHPCLVAFEKLPREQQLKDVLFFNTVQFLK